MGVVLKLSRTLCVHYCNKSPLNRNPVSTPAISKKNYRDAPWISLSTILVCVLFCTTIPTLHFEMYYILVSVPFSPLHGNNIVRMAGLRSRPLVTILRDVVIDHGLDKTIIVRGVVKLNLIIVVAH